MESQEYNNMISLLAQYGSFDEIKRQRESQQEFIDKYGEDARTRERIDFIDKTLEEYGICIHI